MTPGPTRGDGRRDGRSWPQSCSERGQSTIELALVLPVVVLSMLAIAQIGLIGRNYLLVWHSAREAARQAAVNPTTAAARAAALSATPGLEPARLAVSLDGGTESGQLVTATVSYRAPTDVPIVGLAVADVVLSAEVTMRVE